MEIQNLRAIYLPDTQNANIPVYTVIKDRDGLHWSDKENVTNTSFDLPFIDEDWLIMQSTMVEDSNGKELFEMDVVELSGYYQKYFVIVRVGYTFALFDGHSGIVSDPEGTVWQECKYVCEAWNSGNLDTFAPITKTQLKNRFAI